MSTDSTDAKPHPTSGWIEELCTELSLAATEREFSGVILISEGEESKLEIAYGFADRANRRPMSISTRLATASGTKGFTALAVVSMIEEGLFDFDTPLNDVVGDAYPHVDAGVTIEHLLGHTSGVGDYLDEDELKDVDDYVLDVPVHQLLGPEDFVPILNRFSQTSSPGERWVYNNSGYMMLALVVERAGTGTYHDEVRQRVFDPAGLADTDFLRSDRLPADSAFGYLADGRTNVFHLPVVGTGDGGAYTTGHDMLRFWTALFEGRIIGRDLVDRMTAIHNEDPPDLYGLGFWIGPDRTTVQLEGMDAGVSLRSGANPSTGFRYCLIANNSSDVWPLAKIVERYLAPSPADP